MSSRKRRTKELGHLSHLQGCMFQIISYFISIQFHFRYVSNLGGKTSIFSGIIRALWLGHIGFKAISMGLCLVSGLIYAMSVAETPLKFTEGITEIGMEYMTPSRQVK